MSSFVASCCPLLLQCPHQLFLLPLCLRLLDYILSTAPFPSTQSQLTSGFVDLSPPAPPPTAFSKSQQELALAPGLAEQPEVYQAEQEASHTTGAIGGSSGTAEGQEEWVFNCMNDAGWREEHKSWITEQELCWAAREAGTVL